VNKILTLIVTYNGAQWIEKCLRHVMDNTIPSDILVVDNCSTDDTVSIIRAFSSEVKLVQSTENRGFGGANNFGLQHAIASDYSHVFLLNQDAYIQKDCLEKLLNSSQSAKKFGIISPIQLMPNGQQMDQVFHNQIKKYYNPSSVSQVKLLERKEAEQPIEVRFCGAASWFLTVDMVKKVGMFDPAFYHYGEDNNYAARAQYHGFKIGIQPTTSMIHDRNPRSYEAFLPIKLRSFPLHQLVDIRKPFPIAWIVGLNQLRSTRRKILKQYGNQYDEHYQEAKKWFFEDWKKALYTREGFKRSFL
jgi:GT2 family glycosyltransferase